MCYEFKYDFITYVSWYFMFIVLMKALAETFTVVLVLITKLKFIVFIKITQFVCVLCIYEILIECIVR